MKNKGFTLIELVLMIGLLVITAGVSSDIILTLIRSYNKTQISNEIEQNADFVLLKLQKELRNASGIASVPNGQTLIFSNAAGAQITYTVNTALGVITRRVGAGTIFNLVDTSFVGGGVQVQCGSSGSCFSVTGGSVVGIDLVFSNISPAAATGRTEFTGTVPVKTTVVIRGSY